MRLKFLIVMMLLFCSVNAQNSGKTEIFPYLTDSLLYVTNINELNNPLYRSAYVEFNRNEFKKAINLYNSYLAISPDEANGYFNRALCYYKIQDKNQCCNDLKLSAYLGNDKALRIYKNFCDSSINEIEFLESGYLFPETSSNLKNDSTFLPPEFPGGNDSIYTSLITILGSDFFTSNIQAQQGRYILKFNIGVEGDISNEYFIDKNILNKSELIKAFKALSKWYPAKLNSRPIKSTYLFPVVYSSAYQKLCNKFYNKGVQLLNEGKFSESISNFNTSLTFNGRDYEALFNRGICYYKMNNTIQSCLSWSQAYLSNNTKQSIELINKFCDSTIIGSLTINKVDELPIFPGGEEKLMNYFSLHRCMLNLRYNDSSQEVYVSFIVDKNGKAISPKILRTSYSECNEEAIRLINSMPNWLPAKKDGLPIAFEMNYRIRYFNVKY